MNVHLTPQIKPQFAIALMKVQLFFPAEEQVSSGLHSRDRPGASPTLQSAGPFLPRSRRGDLDSYPLR
jgi:hypothetical protein